MTSNICLCCEAFWFTPDTQLTVNEGQVGYYAQFSHIKYVTLSRSVGEQEQEKLRYLWLFLMLFPRQNYAETDLVRIRDLYNVTDSLKLNFFSAAKCGGLNVLKGSERMYITTY